MPPFRASDQREGRAGRSPQMWRGSLPPLWFRRWPLRGSMPENDNVSCVLNLCIVHTQQSFRLNPFEFSVSDHPLFRVL